MKKSNIVFILCLSLFFFFGSTNFSFAKKKNPECAGGSKAVVIQVIDEGVLAKICPPFIIYNSDIYGSYNSFCKSEGTLVHLIKNKDYVDDQIITLKKNECFREMGTYRYTNKLGDTKTIRAIDIIDSKYKH